MTTPDRRAWTRIYAGMALTTMATLLLELALTRIFSVVLFYHFAFMAISIALFGLGIGAVFSYYLVPGPHEPALVWRRLGTLSAANVVATAAALWIVLQQSVSIRVTAETAGKLTLIYFVSAIPFFLAGTVISLAISETIERIHRVYFFDLAGAAAGCLLLVPLLNSLGGPNTVLCAAGLFAVAGCLWFSLAGETGRMRRSFVLGLAMALLIGVNLRTRWIDIRFAKGNRLGNEIFARWNHFSRVAVQPDDGAGRPQIVIDADAATSIPYFPQNASAEARAEMLRGGPGLPYQIHPGAKTLIIGPGGGYDVARALAGGSSDVTGIEINPIIINDVMKGRFAEASQRLYFRPEVHVDIEDGRSYVRRDGPSYQVIQMTLVDTWASTSSGAFALSENNLYTTEAFSDYLRRLTDDGLLAITRWEFDPPRESLRIVSLGIAALRQLGTTQAANHFLICREGAQDLSGYGAKDTVVIKKTPFTAEEIARARDAMTAAKLAPVYIPGERIANPFTDLLLSPDPERFTQEYRYDITPVSDNRPFFFYTVRARELWNFITLRHSEDVKVNMGVMMLFLLFGVSLIATAVIVLAPPLLLGARVPRESSSLVHLAYFLAVGVGFIMIEVGLIQKFVLFLGHPTYSLTVVVFSLLVSSGIGSYASRRLIGDEQGRLAMALVAVALLVTVLSLGVAPMLRNLVGLSLSARCALSVALLFPAGFMMGMPFPCGLRRLERRLPSAVRWAWALNSAASVLGSVAAIFFAIYLGLSQTLLLGAACYLVALTSLRLTWRSVH